MTTKTSDQRANLERRDGRTDWTAIDLEETILVYGEIRAATAINQLLRHLSQTRCYYGLLAT